jgi:2-keto-4-pentenoate hydratase/2-oxohepta-3-ene-1,7-dioic acid hydratase in catechol pathway
MRIASFDHGGRMGFGPVAEGQVADVSAAFGGDGLIGLLALPDMASRIADAATYAPRFALDAVALLPPVPRPGRILCVGLNYRKHIAEMGRTGGDHPTIFVRYADSVVGQGQAMLRPPESTHYDFEGEFAVVIGRGGRRIAAADALEAVAGYTIFNDATLRDYQAHSSQFTPGKNFWHSGACGPWLLTRGAAPPIEAMTLTTRLNGVVMQQAGLDDLLFSVPVLIEYLSRLFPLMPGDIIATGTPGGVGAGRSPKLWMKAGDRIEVEIDAIGTLANPVRDEQG